MPTLTETQTLILENLSHYSFLTHSQMYRLKLGNLQYIRHCTKKLKNTFRKPLVGAIVSPVVAGVGRIENVYYLTKSGAKELGELYSRPYQEFGFRNFRNGIQNRARQYWHRKYCIDFQIGITDVFQEHKQIALGFVERYFDWNKDHKNNETRTPPVSQTKIFLNDGENFIIPDEIFMLQGRENNNAKALFMMEMINGQNTKRVLDQIFLHTQAMEQGCVSQAKGVKKTGVISLFLFSHKGTMNAVRKRFYEIHNNMESFENAFFFACVDEAEKDILRCWQRPAKLGDNFYHFVTGRAVPSNSPVSPRE